MKNKFRKKWTNAELELLKEVYPHYTNKELSERFFPNRTPRAIESCASKMGWSGKSEDGYIRACIARSEAMKGIPHPMSEEAKRKSSATKRAYFQKSDDPNNPANETRRKMSEAKKRVGKWEGEDNPRHKTPLFGEKNGRWQGGITDLYRGLRNGIGQWQRDSMEFCHYKCVITGGEFDDVHHTTPFRDLEDMTFSNLNIDIRDRIEDCSDDELSIIYDELNKIHSIYGFGACLHKDVHKLFHDNYGYTKFNPEDFLDFCVKAQNGYFDKWFKDYGLSINLNKEYIEYLNKINDFLKEDLVA